jgi:NAD(P)-dependent dehydrogenase (short-subunit alcohol dehydrogenase family)
MSKRKVVLVTGSTSGIGLGIAKEFASNGYDIGLNGLGDAAVVETIKRDIEVNFGAQVFYSDADMSKPNEIERFVKDANDALGAVDVLINNAGVQHVSPVEHFPTDKWDFILAVNLSSAFHMSRLLIPSMRSHNFGRILNIEKSISKEDVIRDVILARQPTQKFVQVDQIAALALFLASDKASSITGSSYCIDGGWTAH